MDDCPNCGTPVEDDAASCQDCGAALAVRDTESGRDSADQSQRRRPPEGMQPPEGITGGDRANQQKVGPFTRRQLLLGGGGAVAIGGAWYLFGGGSTGREPEAVLREYVQAVSDGDPDAASTTVHQDSPATDELVGQTRGTGGPLTPGDGEDSLTVDSVEERSRETAPSTEGVQSFVTLEATVSVSGGADGESQTQTTLVVTMAQNAGGLWKLWTVETSQSTS